MHGSEVRPTVRAIYEDGVCKPSGPVDDLPDKAEVELEARLVQPQAEVTREQVRQGILEVLSRRYRTGQTDVMRRLGIVDAFTNDRHFKMAGFQSLF